jgi:hypothetical protein
LLTLPYRSMATTSVKGSIASFSPAFWIWRMSSEQTFTDNENHCVRCRLFNIFNSMHRLVKDPRESYVERNHHPSWTIKVALGRKRLDIAEYPIQEHLSSGLLRCFGWSNSSNTSSTSNDCVNSKTFTVIFSKFAT